MEGEARLERAEIRWSCYWRRYAGFPRRALRDILAAAFGMGPPGGGWMHGMGGGPPGGSAAGGAVGFGVFFLDRTGQVSKSS